MKKRIISFNLSDENLTIITDGNTIKNVKFPLKIKQVEEFSDVLVVRLDVPADILFNENVFGVSSEGKILWQIIPMKSGFKSSRYTGLFKKGDLVKVHNWDGTDLLLEPRTGEILKESYSK